MPVTIRPAGPDDLGAVVAMAARFYATTSYATLAPFCECSAGQLYRMLMDSGVMLVAEKKGRVMGMVGLALAPYLFNRAHVTAHEVMWWVEPEDRGKTGAGVALLRAILPACRERTGGAIRAIQMMRMHDSPRQVDMLYRRLGFVPSESTYTMMVN